MSIAALPLILLTPLLGARVEAAPEVVRDAQTLRKVADAARPGARIEIAPGTYAGGLQLVGLRGTAARPIVIAAQDRARRPVFRGGTVGLHLSRCAHLELEDLVLVGARGNGINVDDGGPQEKPAHHITLRRLEVRDVGPRGNCDGIKLSGVADARIEECVVRRWGTGGSAVDMVGCHRMTIVGCRFVHEPGMSGGSGVQAKGGSSEIRIEGNRFEHAGSRAVNAGGGTGFSYFRPPIEDTQGPLAEARGVRVVENTVVGSMAAVAFVGVDGAEVRRNTIYRPGRWAFRILQETRDERFVPARKGVIERNLIVFRSDAWSGGGVNVGPGTSPETFSFSNNAWFCEDAPARTRALVRLPSQERDGSYGVDPRLVDPDRGDLRIGRSSKLRDVGAPGAPPAKAGAR